jgi:GNAT superfamily N-acetyltransferase
MKPVRVRPAAIEEASALTAMASRAKASWGYDEAAMARAPVRIEPASIAEGWVWVAEGDRRRPIGVAVLARTAEPAVFELQALYVEPIALRTDAGAALLRRVTAIARSLGGATLRIVADPNAARFYETLGARKVGEDRSVAGRAHPLYELSLAEGDAT